MLPQGAQVLLWLVRPGQLREDAAAGLAALLEPSEQERAARFVFDRDRVLFRTGRGLLRRELGRLLGASPRSLSFSFSPRGKPQLDGCPVSFNVSHTEGLLALAIAAPRVGVDVERFSRPLDVLGVAGQVFSPQEMAALRQEQGRSRFERFACLWTLKEAYIKGTGEGLAAPLQQLTCDVLQPARPRILGTPAGPERPVDWSFATFRPSEEHWGAVALESAEPVELVPQEV